MKKATLLIVGIISSGIIYAQNTIDESKVEVIPCSHFGISKPLRELFEAAPPSENEENENIEREESQDREHRTPQVFKYTAEDGPEYGEDISVHQTTMGTRPGRAPLTNWLGQTGAGYPPDPTGAAGPNHYVQAVNATPIKVFNKTTGAQVGTVHNLGSLWNPAVGNNGDPIVLYDKYADRWFISQFGTSTDKMIYIAISTTPDPTGTYYTYSFTSPQFPDYLKFSIWADGYYMTSNQQSDKIFCFERAQMLLGNAASRSIYKPFSPTANVGNFFIPLPADADGGLPPYGTPCPFFAFKENSWGGGGSDSIKIWTMSVDWTPATPTATLTAPIKILSAAFDGSYSASWSDIPQPGSTQKLDGIGGSCMFRAQWRKWTGYNSVVLNWGVKISATQRSIRWCELHQDQTTGTWTIYQQSTYVPDASSRWMGSIAMDDNGNIALCYAISDGTSISPSLAYTGRLVSDPINTMTFAETIAQAGSGAQTFTNRYGDYSQTSIDPANGLVFWHTGEYLYNGGIKTKIYSFALDPTSNITENELTQTSVLAFQSNSTLIINGNNLPSNEELVVDLFDATGKQISKKLVTPSSSSFETNFDVSNLSKGIYLLRVGKTNSYFQKVTKVFIH